MRECNGYDVSIIRLDWLESGYFLNAMLCFQEPQDTNLQRRRDIAGYHATCKWYTTLHSLMTTSCEDATSRVVPPLLVQPLVVQSDTRFARRRRRCAGCRTRRAVSKQAAATHGASTIAQTLSRGAIERLLEQWATAAGIGREGRVGRRHAEAAARAPRQGRLRATVLVAEATAAWCRALISRGCDIVGRCVCGAGCLRR